MKPIVWLLVVLVLPAAGQTAGGERKTENMTATSSDSAGLLGRVLALGDLELEAFRGAVFMLDRTDDFLVVLKSAAGASRDSYYRRVGEAAAQRNRQRLKEMGEVTKEQAAAAERSVAELLKPAVLQLYSGMVLMQQGKDLEAAEKCEIAFAAGAGTRDAYYAAACCWAKVGRKDDAFRNLQKAADAGWPAIKEMQADADLESLHSDPRWGELVASMEQKLAKRLAALPEAHTPLAAIKLPEPALDGKFPVERALAQRRSVRQFAKEPLTLAELSQLLWAAYGITKPVPNGPAFLRGGMRTAPSAGGLYPLELYIVAGDVTGLEPGIYRYKSETHELELIRRGDCRAELYSASADQPWVKAAPASIVYSAIFTRTTGKYGDRGRERYVWMDAGHSGENLYLEATAMGLGTCALGAFHDSDVRLCVGMTRTEEPLYIFPIGRAKPVK